MSFYVSKSLNLFRDLVQITGLIHGLVEMKLIRKNKKISLLNMGLIPLLHYFNLNIFFNSLLFHSIRHNQIRPKSLSFFSHYCLFWVGLGTQQTPYRRRCGEGADNGELGMRGGWHSSVSGLELSVVSCVFAYTKKKMCVVINKINYKKYICSKVGSGIMARQDGE